MPLKGLNLGIVIAASTADLIRQFYKPVLSQSVSYYRGFGLFPPHGSNWQEQPFAYLRPMGGMARLVAKSVWGLRCSEALK
jgi:hypothetical protein